jgi:hypothetical protein
VKVRADHPMVRRTATATLLLSLGITIGSYARPRGAAPPDQPSGKPARAVQPAPARRQDSTVANQVAPGAMPSAPGFQPFLVAAPRPDFGGAYAVLRGAETSGEHVPQPQPFSPPPLPAVPPAPETAVATATSSPAGPDTAGPRSASSAETGPERFRPSPAQGIPRGIALRHPLLALARPGGRVAFHDLGLRGTPTPAGIEGEWAVIGRCERTMRIDFALPSRRAGELRGIGRSMGSGGGNVEAVVPRQACAAATDRFSPARVASESDRARLGGAGEALGFDPADLAQWLEVRGTTLLVFRRPGRGSVLVAAAAGNAPAVLWIYRVEAADGDPSLLGVYRTGAGGEAWLTLGGPSSPDALLVASSPDGRTWETSGPAPFREP